MSILPNCKISHSEVKLIVVQENFSVIRLIEFKHQNKRDPWGVKTPLGWPLSGSLGQLQGRKCKAPFYFCFAEEQQNSEVTQWWVIENYGSSKNVESLSEEEKRVQEILQSTTKIEVRS